MYEICMFTYPSHMLARQTEKMFPQLGSNGPGCKGTFPFCKRSSGASERRSGCQEAFSFLVCTDLGLVPATLKITLK